MMDSGTGSGHHLFFDGSCHGNMLLLGNGDPALRGGSRSFLTMEEISKRRPFFSTSDELMDEEFYDEQLPEKKRRLTPDQVHMLEKSFEAENKLEPERKTQLAKKLGLQPRQVAVWFQNRRARWKTKTLERDYDLLKSSYDSLRSDYDSVVKDNEKLKSEVVLLTEKLQAKEVGVMVELGRNSDSLLPSHPLAEAHVTGIQFNVVKIEDRLSSGSGGSAVVDEDGLQLVDSGDSYFPNNENYGHIKDDGGGGSDDNPSYFSDVFAAAAVAEHNQQDEAEPLGWWVWS